MEPLAADERTNWRRMGTGALVLTVGLVLFSTGSRNDATATPKNADLSFAMPGPKSKHDAVHYSASIDVPHFEEEKISFSSSPTMSDSDQGGFEIVIDMHDLLEYRDVLEFIRKVGLDKDSPREHLLEYLPHKIIMKGDKKLMQGVVGEDADDGYVAFSITKMNQTIDHSYSYNSAFHIVMNMNGSIASIAPTMLHLGMKNHITAMKFFPANPSYMMIAVDIEASEDGPYYLWNWDNNAGLDIEEQYKVLLNGSSNNCHDFQMQFDGDYIWGIGTGPDLFDTRIIESTGYDTRIVMVDIQYTSGAKSLNHVQMIEEDTVAIVSEKVRNAIIKVNMSTEEIVFVAGGPNGTLKLIDELGLKHELGTSLWYGQHNAEYFGENEYLMFDDQTSWHETQSVDSEKTHMNSSRLLVVNVNETRGTAEIVWSYDLGYHTSHFGDLDMLATGNLLGAGWVTKKLPGGFHPGFEAQLVEVTRDTKQVAWELTVLGNHTKDEKESDEYVLFDSWSVYSAERMYTTPLLYDIECCYKDSKTVEISFVSHGRFKENNVHQAQYELSVGKSKKEKVLASAEFYHKAYLRPTTVTFTAAAEPKNIQNACEMGRLTIMDRWGTSITKPIGNS